MKQVGWDIHALERRKERKISFKLIEDSIKNPDRIIIKGKRKIIHKLYRDLKNGKEYLLRIFISEYRGKIVIRTVYRTSKMKKYKEEKP